MAGTKDLVDSIYFQELSRQDPQDVCRRALCTYDDTSKSYELSVWTDEYDIFPDQLRITCISQNPQSLHEYFNIFMIHYLLKSKEMDISKEWISEKDIPGGSTFFRGPHEIPTNLISRRFGNDVDAFKGRCEKLHGKSLNMADTAFCFNITPRIPVAVLYWKGDDDFPAEAKMLFDKTIIDQLPSDIIFALAFGICERLGRPL